MPLVNKKADFNFNKFAACFGTFSVGGIVGWFSPALIILDSDDSPLETGRLTVEQISLLGGLQSVGACVGTIGFAIFSHYFGFRKAVWLVSIPALITWILVIFGDKIEYLYISRFLGGAVIGGVFYAIPLFITEISDEHIRGRMGSMMVVLDNIAILLAYIQGTYLSYTLTAALLLIGPIILGITFAFIPETPMYLLSKDNENLQKSLNFYKNCKRDSEESKERYNAELSKIKNLLENREFMEKLSFKDFTTPQARYGFFVGIATSALSVFHGNVVLLNYSSFIFRESGTDFDPVLALVIFPAIQLIAAFTSIFLIDQIGRKTLLSISTFLCTIAYFSLGIYSYLSESEVNVNVVNWVPLASASTVLFGSSVGIMPVSMVITAESFPSKIRSQGLLICSLLLHLLMIVATASFPILTDNYNLYVPMWIFAAVCGVAFFYAVFFLKETNRKNLFLPN